MEIYSSENEQLDAVRRFFLQYGKVIIIALVLGAVGIFGWRYWQDHKAVTLMKASNNYDQVVIALVMDQDDAVALAQRYIEMNPNNYGAMATLQLVQYLVDKGDYAGAEKQLSNALTYTNDENLLSVAQLRLARLQHQQKNDDAALKSLEAVKGNSWRVQAMTLRGDIYRSQGQNDAARAAYEQALALEPIQSEASILQIKLNNISG